MLIIQLFFVPVNFRVTFMQWFAMGIVVLVLGIIMHFSHGKDTKGLTYICLCSSPVQLNPVLSHSLAAIPLNKQLYTFSYICVTASAAGIVFYTVPLCQHATANMSLCRCVEYLCSEFFAPKTSNGSSRFMYEKSSILDSRNR